MESFERPTERPSIGTFYGFDHVVFWVGNAKQAASYYTSRFGFEYFAYKGLETGERKIATHVLKKDKIIFAFQSSYGPFEDKENEIGNHVLLHGDGVRDVAFTVDDAKGIFEKAVSRGAKAIRQPETLTDENGSVVIASVQTYGDTIHTFVQRDKYKEGLFLPGYNEHFLKDPLNDVLPDTKLMRVDHCVGNQALGDMEPVATWYEKMLDFHRFWSVDDTVLHTEYSALKSIVVADFDEVVKMPINEPAKGKKKSQIEEYVDYYAGAGVQHIALFTDNILETVENLTKRGVEFLQIPKAYYERLRKNFLNLAINKMVKEDLDILEKFRILIDYDDKGYLLQIFTKPVEDRPTLFFEIIQRRNHQGFGAGNFKSLFESIEEEQGKRGNL